MDLLRVTLARCTLDEWERTQAGKAVILPNDRHLVSWTGKRAEWWWAGMRRLPAIPADHDGLYLAMNALGAAFTVAIRGTYRRKDAQ